MIYVLYNVIKLLFWITMHLTMETLKSLNILYAEDDELTRKNTLKTLSLFVGHVFEADNGADALKLFHQENIHIVILDFVMPSIDLMLST